MSKKKRTTNFSPKATAAAKKFKGISRSKPSSLRAAKSKAIGKAFESYYTRHK